MENAANLQLREGRTAEQHRWSSLSFFVLSLQIVGGTGAPVRILTKCDPRVYSNTAAPAYGTNYKLGIGVFSIGDCIFAYALKVLFFVNVVSRTTNLEFEYRI